MPKSHLPYPPEFRQQMIELVRSGRTPGELGREFECSAQTIRNWVHQANLDEGRRDDGLTTAEREELRRLRREVKQLRMERDILKKAAAWFARESNAVPEKFSDS
jgi:transposase